MIVQPSLLMSRMANRRWAVSICLFFKDVKAVLPLVVIKKKKTLPLRLTPR